jgi:hypothetical protein
MSLRHSAVRIDISKFQQRSEIRFRTIHRAMPHADEGFGLFKCPSSLRCGLLNSSFYIFWEYPLRTGHYWEVVRSMSRGLSTVSATKDLCLLGHSTLPIQTCFAWSCERLVTRWFPQAEYSSVIPHQSAALPIIHSLPLLKDLLRSCSTCNETSWYSQKF